MRQCRAQCIRRAAAALRPPPPFRPFLALSPPPTHPRPLSAVSPTLFPPTQPQPLFRPFPHPLPPPHPTALVHTDRAPARTCVSGRHGQHLHDHQVQALAQRQQVQGIKAPGGCACALRARRRRRAAWGRRQLKKGRPLKRGLGPRGHGRCVQALPEQLRAELQLFVRARPACQVVGEGAAA